MRRPRRGRTIKLIPEPRSGEDVLAAPNDDHFRRRSSANKTDWKGEQERRGALRPIHRYSRVERFIGVLYQLLGYRGTVPKDVLEVVRYWGIEKGKEWEGVRFILKQYEWSKYYNMIPAILYSFGIRHLGIQYFKVEEIVCKFMSMSENFNSKKFSGRVYFPNLRYVALRLLDESGMEFGYHIPKIRTKRKEAVMQDIYDKLCVYDNK